MSLSGSSRRSTVLPICIEPFCSRMIVWSSCRDVNAVMSSLAVSRARLVTDVPLGANGSVSVQIRIRGMATLTGRSPS